MQVLGTFMRFSWMFEDFGRTFWNLNGIFKVDFGIMFRGISEQPGASMGEN